MLLLEMISDREETRYWITARYPFQVVHKSIVIFLIFSCNLRWFIVRRAITDETDEKIYYSKFCERCGMESDRLKYNRGKEID